MKLERAELVFDAFFFVFGVVWKLKSYERFFCGFTRQEEGRIWSWIFSSTFRCFFDGKIGRFARNDGLSGGKFIAFLSEAERLLYGKIV